MKRLLRPVEAGALSDTISKVSTASGKASGKASNTLSKAAGALTRLFDKIDKFFKMVGEWDSGDKQVFEIETEIPDPYAETESYITFRLLLKCIDAGDDYQIFNAYLKRKEDGTDRMISETGIKYTLPVDATPEDATAQCQAWFNDVIKKLINSYLKALIKAFPDKGYDVYEDGGYLIDSLRQVS